MIDENIVQRDVREWIAEQEAIWNAMTEEEREAKRAENHAINEKWRKKLENTSIEDLIGDDLAESLGKPGWKYYDLPKMTHECFDQFIEIAGSENLSWITYASYTSDNRELVRGQMLISPEGIEKLRVFAEGAPLGAK